MSTEHCDVIVLGAGIGGLACAYYAKKAGLSVELIEETSRPGGVIRSLRKDGFLLEFGPNTVQPTAELMEIIRDLELSGEVVLADEKSPRYIQLKGSLHQIPMSPAAIFKTDILTFFGKLRLLLEPLIPADRNENDESIAVFFRRRLGKEATEKLLWPFVSGVWAGDPEKLSMKSTFGTLFEYEKKHGSLLKGFLKNLKEIKSKAAAVPKGLLNFKEGLEVLAVKLAAFLQKEMIYGEITEEVIPPISPNQFPRWKIRTSHREITSDFLVFALPTRDVSKLVKPFASGTAWSLSEIPTVPIAVIHLGCNKNSLNRELDGFGFLTGSQERSDILGCLWNSSLFPNRAPQGKELLTVLIGGAKQGEKVFLNDTLITHKVYASLAPILKFREFPEVLAIYRHEAAIPQYTLGHPSRLKVFENAQKSFPGLRFAGNYLNGIGVGNVIQLSKKVAEDVWEESKTIPQTVREKTLFSPGWGR